MLVVVFGWNKIVVEGIDYINNYKFQEPKIEKSIEGSKQFLKDTEQLINEVKKNTDKNTNK
jgi:glutaredoxin-related protein